jgi:hypothetical protein
VAVSSGCTLLTQLVCVVQALARPAMHCVWALTSDRNNAVTATRARRIVESIFKLILVVFFCFLFGFVVKPECHSF